MGKKHFESLRRRQHGKHTFIECTNVSLNFIRDINYKCDDPEFRESVSRFKMITDGCYYDKLERSFFVISHVWVSMCLLYVNYENRDIIIKELDNIYKKLCEVPKKTEKKTAVKKKLVKSKPDYGNMLEKVDVTTLSVKEKNFLDKIKNDVLDDDFNKMHGLNPTVYKIILDNADDTIELEPKMMLRDFCITMWNKYRIATADIYKNMSEKGYLIKVKQQHILNKKSLMDNIGVNLVDDLTKNEYTVLNLKGMVYFLQAMFDTKLIDKKIVPIIKN